MRITQLLPTGLLDRKLFGVPGRVWFPIIVVLLLVAGLFSPLFDLNSIHGFSGKVYAQHAYFDFIAGAGGFWAGSFCSHWYHRVPLFLFIDAITTLALVTIVG